MAQSSIKVINERWSLAKSPSKTANLDPDNLAASSVSIFLVISRWSRVLVLIISPCLLIILLSSSDDPSGTESWGMFGISSSKLFKFFKTSWSSESFFSKSEFFLSITFFKSEVSSPDALSFPNSDESFFLSAWRFSTSIWSSFLESSKDLKEASFKS